VFLGTVNGIIVRSPTQERTFGVVASELPRLDSVLTSMRERQKAIRDSTERERQEAIAIAVRTRRPVYHVVQRGEALESIARQYNITVEQLQEWNQLSGPRIQVGHQLLVKPRT
jgi:membrane-bound lytic murein transglycosylase D